MIGPPALSILIYHRVLARPDPLLPGLPDVRTFARQMALVKRCFAVLPLHVAVARLRHGTLPPRALSITFDDGYADNAELALPVLRELGLHATFFIATAYLDGGRMWNDDVIEYVRRSPAGPLDLGAIGLGQVDAGTLAQKQQLIDHILGHLKHLPFAQRQGMAQRLAPPRGAGPMMTTHQVRQLLAAGMGLGAHTHHHPILATMADTEAMLDIAEGKAVLERLGGQAVSLFAYPNGKPDKDYDQRHVAMLRKLGFEAAVTTQSGIARPTADPLRLLQLPRFTPWQADPTHFVLRLAWHRWREQLRRRAAPACGTT